MNLPAAFALDGKFAAVTGGAGGLGAAAATALAEAGADVALLDIDETGLGETADAIAARGRSAMVIRCDITDENDVKRAFSRIDSEFGDLGILVNNAGMGDPDPKRIDQYDTQTWRRVLSLNIDAQFFCARAALKPMLAAQRGKIINVASMWGLAGPSSIFPLPAYATSKGAIVNFTREMALQYASDGICVNALCPGFFRTRLGPYGDPEFEHAITDFTPMGRIADASEIGGSVIYLASAASDFVTGTTLLVDGGCLAK